MVQVSRMAANFTISMSNVKCKIAPTFSCNGLKISLILFFKYCNKLNHYGAPCNA